MDQGPQNPLLAFLCPSPGLGQVDLIDVALLEQIGEYLLFGNTLGFGVQSDQRGLNLAGTGKDKLQVPSAGQADLIEGDHRGRRVHSQSKSFSLQGHWHHSMVVSQMLREHLGQGWRDIHLTQVQVGHLIMDG
ncbi:hypothetical protein HKBW3S42_00878 [Candidatus Hakubella thermalkaliphila]|uniref:Uncharacterized protein n=1 Tax=Candidatus Hakubella thermalkaliphila TaxID=2754717 RepID=A0A6V8PLF6_9ACTN|nr:hypothetical protein HKBW3S42_00878 [Candidatus Hakubella thermalkaliphila]